MPADFDRCKKNGGKIRTVSGPSKKPELKSEEYVHFCTLKGKTVMGYVKSKQGSKEMDKAYVKSKKRYA